MYVPGKPGICFHYHCAVYDECKYSNTICLADCTRLLVQYAISLSSLCKLIVWHWTYKMPVRYILSSVWVRLSIFSPLSIIQYVGLFVFSLPISLVMIEIIIYFVLLPSSNRQLNYYPLFMVRSWNNGVRCMSFYILISEIDITVFQSINSLIEAQDGCHLEKKYIIVYSFWKSEEFGKHDSIFI